MTRTLFYVLLLLTAFLSPRISRAQSIESYLVVQSFDVCGTYWATAHTSGYTPGQTFKFFWGDGTSDTGTFTPGAADTANFVRNHFYATPGTYTVKMVLYNGAPLDSVVISEDIRNCHFMNVWAKVDENSNCVADSSEPWVHTYSSVEIDSAGIHVDTVSMWAVINYKALGSPGTVYRFRVIVPPGGMALACGSTGIVYDTVPAIPFTTASTKFFLYDCVSASTSSFDLKLSASFFTKSLATVHPASIVVNNNTCSPVATTLRYDFSPKYAVDSVVPAYSYTVSGTSATIDLGPTSMHTPRVVYVYLHPVVTLVAGDTANSTFTVMPFAGDTLLSNNIVVRCDTVKASYDPNRKSVLPQGDIAPGTRLEYLLEFENTGNDSAHNIHIMDTLSPYLDPATFAGGNSTHNVAYYQYSDGGNNIVKFDFPNIMLPDSSSSYRHGMVSFYINAREGLAPGTTIPNRAGIYFDANEVVLTNTIYSHIPYPDNINATPLPMMVELYPNPVNDALHISTARTGHCTTTVYNIVGQVVLQKEFDGGNVILDVGHLAPAIYYAVVRGADGARALKFEKK